MATLVPDSDADCACVVRKEKSEVVCKGFVVDCECCARSVMVAKLAMSDVAVCECVDTPDSNAVFAEGFTNN